MPRSRSLPPNAIDPKIASIAIAVTRGAGSYRQVRDAVGWGSIAVLRRWLLEAESAGLIHMSRIPGTGDDSSGRIHQGSIRPALTVVAHTPASARRRQR